MLRVNTINSQELLKRITFHSKSLVFKTVSVPVFLGLYGFNYFFISSQAGNNRKDTFLELLPEYLAIRTK